MTCLPSSPQQGNNAWSSSQRDVEFHPHHCLFPSSPQSSKHSSCSCSAPLTSPLALGSKREPGIQKKHNRGVRLSWQEWWRPWVPLGAEAPALRGWAARWRRCRCKRPSSSPTQSRSAHPSSRFVFLHSSSTPSSSCVPTSQSNNYISCSHFAWSNWSLLIPLVAVSNCRISRLWGHSSTPPPSTSNLPTCRKRGSRRMCYTHAPSLPFPTWHHQAKLQAECTCT